MLSTEVSPSASICRKRGWHGIAFDELAAGLGRPSDVMGAWFVYVILCPAGIAYTGIAKDVAARLDKHNAGRGARFTRGRGPWRLAHVEGPLAHGEALRRECAIKRDTAFKNGLKKTVSPT